MHSSIVGFVLKQCFDFIIYYEFPWDNVTWTFFDFFVCMLFIAIICLFVFYVMFFIKNMYVRVTNI